jgi:nitroreductase
MAAETISFPVTSNHFLKSAPVLVAIITGVPSLKMRIGGALQDRPYHLIDMGIAAEHFCLQATEEGLGTCMIGWLNNKKISVMLNVPKDKRVEMLIALGYSSETPRKKVRKNLDEIRAYNLS